MSTPPPTMTWELLEGGVLVIAHSEHDPTDAEFEAAIDVYRENLRLPLRGIVFSSRGGMPNALQRDAVERFWKEAKEVYGIDTPAMVVMTSERMVQIKSQPIEWALQEFASKPNHEKAMPALGFDDWDKAFKALDIGLTESRLRGRIRAAASIMHRKLSQAAEQANNP